MMRWKFSKPLVQRVFSGTVPNQGFITLVIEGREVSPRIPVGIVYEARDAGLFFDIAKTQLSWTAKKSGEGEVRVFCDDTGEEYLLTLPVGPVRAEDPVTYIAGSEKQIVQLTIPALCQIDKDFYLRAARDLK